AGQWGGMTAMATYALLCAGEDPKTNPQLAAAIAWQKKADVTGTYALAFRTLMWDELARTDPSVKEYIRHDAEILGKGAMNTKGQVRGMWHYKPTDNGSYDHSTAQFGLLGMTMVDRNGVNVPMTLWQAADTQWKQDQQADGTWAYTPPSPSGTVR